MKVRHNIVAFVLAGLAGMAVNANAAAKCTAGPQPGVPHAVKVSCALEQTAQPPTRAYPGVDLSILGFRTGMTVSQVEANAAKLHLGKPEIETAHPQDSVKAGNATASDEGGYIDQISYHLKTNDVEYVMVFFSSPATGNRSEAVYTDHNSTWDRTTKRQMANQVMAKLIGQYGPTSFHRPDSMSQYLCWNFRGHSLIKTSPYTQSCYPGGDHNAGVNVADAFEQRGSQPADFYVFALLSTNDGQVNDLMQGLGDFGLADLDRAEIRKQLTSAAAKYNQQAKGSADAKK